MLKLLCFDTETTGLDPTQHEIVQLSGCIATGETAGSMEPRSWFDFRARPDHPDRASPEALAVTGYYTLAEMASWPRRDTMYQMFIDLLGKHVDKFDKQDKLQPFGYNVDFDMRHLSEFARTFDPKYGIGSYAGWHKLDVLARLHWSLFASGQSVASRKLSAICEIYHIGLRAHDSLEDIRATMRLANELKFCRFVGDLEPFDVIRNYQA